MPQSTDLVTDLPADFETFGQAVATSMADLLGGTTGQILSKASNTDMDFTWTTPNPGDITAVTAGTGLSGGGTSGAVTLSIDTATTVDLTTAQTLTNKTLTSPALTTPTISTLTTNGDLLYGTGSGAIARRAIGTTGQVLTVSGGVPTWAAPAGGGKVLQVVTDTLNTNFTNATSTWTDVGLTVSITPSATTSRIMVFLSAPYVVSTRSGAVTSNYSNVRALRDSTVIQNASIGTYRNASSTDPQFLGSWSVAYLDSPATTSSVTYKMQAATAESSDVSVYSSSTNIASITVMEIGA